jgi:general secretion pathway protein A
MYHEYFRLREEPFGASPDPRFFYQTEPHREALASLYLAILERRGFAALIGEPGLGKTSILVELRRAVERKAYVAHLPHPFYDAASLLESVLEAFGIDPKSSHRLNCRLFQSFLIKARKAGKSCVVIFDEAQNLSRDTLEAIRMLSNFETPSEKLVQIVLAGQPDLASMLMRRDCEQIRQRIGVLARLRRLTSVEVAAYISHRLRVAGAQGPLFSSTACDEIAAASGGIPRDINTISFNALTLAFALNREQVSHYEVAECLSDLDLQSCLVEADKGWDRQLHEPWAER